MARPPKQEERSEEIMRAFEACVVRKGIASTKLTDIAQEAGLPRSLVRYFMGNRDDMVDRLIDRLLSRAETSLARIRDEHGAIALHALLDLYVDELFANELSNTVMGELWHLAESDAHVRERLKGVYGYAIDMLVAAMAREKIGTAKGRRDAAFVILSMILGQTSLADFGVEAPQRAMRKAATAVIGQLTRGTGQ
ncbi:MAG: TetR/AcrR family transcriptional regulator [Rhizobiaceae bacterium]|nr:TetR/AcrR family transcriptional regulator [Rhizobiaceae bacterium]